MKLLDGVHRGEFIYRRSFIEKEGGVPGCRCTVEWNLLDVLSKPQGCPLTQPEEYILVAVPHPHSHFFLSPALRCGDSGTHVWKAQGGEPFRPQNALIRFKLLVALPFSITHMERFRQASLLKWIGKASLTVQNQNPSEYS